MRRLVYLFSFLIVLAACGADESNNKEEVFASSESKEELIQKGNVLFNTNCKLCHSLDVTTPSSLAPTLDSIQYHWPERDILSKYIKNAPNMMQENERSRMLYQQWKNKPQMPPFLGLSQEDVQCIIEYLYNNT